MNEQSVINKYTNMSVRNIQLSEFIKNYVEI